MSLKNTEKAILGLVILGLLMVMGYLFIETFKLGHYLNGGFSSIPPNPVMTTTPDTTAKTTPDNSPQNVVNHSLNLPPSITPAGQPMDNVTPGINPASSTTQIIPPTPTPLR